LMRDPTIKLQRVLFEPPLLSAAVTEADLQALGNPRRTLPSEPDALLAYDCIILGDVDPKHLPASERQRLEKYVKEHGKTLIILAGKRFMPLSFVNDRAAEVEPDKKKEDKEDPLLKLLPIQEPRVVSPKEGFRRTPTEEGKRTPFMQMAEKPEDS